MPKKEILYLECTCNGMDSTHKLDYTQKKRLPSNYKGIGVLSNGLELIIGFMQNVVLKFKYYKKAYFKVDI